MSDIFVNDVSSTTGEPIDVLLFLVLLHNNTLFLSATQPHLHITEFVLCRALYAFSLKDDSINSVCDIFYDHFVRLALHWFLCVDDICRCPGPPMMANITPYKDELVPSLCIYCGLTSFPRESYPPDRCICNCTPCVCGMFIDDPENWTDPDSLPPTSSQLLARRQVLIQKTSLLNAH